MLHQILAPIGVTGSLHFPDVSDIWYLTNISTTLEYNITHPPTYDHPHRPILIKNESNNQTIPYKKYCMALTKILNACHI